MAPRKELKELRSQLAKIRSEIKEICNNKQKVGGKINDINKEIDLLKTEKKKIKEQINTIYDEQNRACYEYEEQQKLIYYIKKATAKINGMIKREEKNNKYKKNEAKIYKNYEDGKIENNQIFHDKPKSKINKVEIHNYEEENNYFEASLPQNETTILSTENKTNFNNKITEEISKENFKKMDYREDDLNSLNESKNVNNEIGEQKSSKESEKQENSCNDLDFETMQKISDAGLPAPLVVDNIPKFLEGLDKTEENFDKDNVEISDKKEEKDE